MADPKIIVTADGSHSLYLEELDEHYHSSHGALTESRHVFIDAGLKPLLNNNSFSCINILELGFGTGLNCLLTFIEASEYPDKQFHYTTIESDPVDVGIISALNYVSLTSSDMYENFERIHTAEWNKIVPISPNFSLFKFHGKLMDFTCNEPADLVYYDAFGPRVQPELWELPALEKITSCMKPDSVFVTYCAQGAFRRNIRSLGFIMESLPGPPGKREMTRAVKRS